MLSWPPPSNNGAEITKYTVTSIAGRRTRSSAQSTTCTLDGLTNNVEYTFLVTATNRVGESEPVRPVGGRASGCPPRHPEPADA